MTALYSDKLLDQFRNYRNYGTLTNPDISSRSFHTQIGDRIRNELKIGDNCMKVVRFRGDGCAISIAAASLLTEVILNTDPDKISDDQLLAALESDIKPARIQCALLPHEALRAGLKIYDEQH